MVFDPADPADTRDAKVVLQIDRPQRLERQVQRLNAVHSGGIVPRATLRDPLVFELLDGSLDD